MNVEGNVIHADFRRDLAVPILLKHEILYTDEHICLGRCTFGIGRDTFIVHAMVERDA